mmetsp:Transcript_5710/g.20327  ORF Transcript_5710/g.20327 Transcript_5710/m.20327 type:complete len:245 (+) Transcript_5710:1-735(+)
MQAAEARQGADGDTRSLALARSLQAADERGAGGPLRGCQRRDALDLTGSDDDDGAFVPMQDDDGASARQARDGDDASLDLARSLAQEGGRYSGAAPPPAFAPPRRTFVGDHFCLNTLAADVADSGQSVGNESTCKADVVDAAMLLWHTPSLLKALFTSFGVSYAWMRYLLRGSKVLETPGDVVMVDNYDHNADSALVRRGRPGEPFTVVSPPMYGSHASAGERSRNAKASVHPKVWILVFELED